MRGAKDRWVRAVGLGAVAALVAAGLVVPAPASAGSVQSAPSVQRGAGGQSAERVQPGPARPGPGSVNAESQRRGGEWAGGPGWNSGSGWHRPYDSGWAHPRPYYDRPYYYRQAYPYWRPYPYRPYGASWGAPAPAWIPGQWAWNGWGWVWQPGYWR